MNKQDNSPAGDIARARKKGGLNFLYISICAPIARSTRRAA
jgi:hypothetical protein